MRVGVTGATGFTGGHTLRALVDAGHTPKALVRSNDKLTEVCRIHGIDEVDATEGTIVDPDAVGAFLADCDAVVHTAAVAFIGAKHRAHIEQTNVPGTITVLGQAAALGLDPIVHLSSTAALHPPPGGHYLPDNPLTPSPVGPYATSKVTAERFARELQDQGHPVVIVWPSGITGPDDAGLSVAAEGIARLLRQPFLPLPKSGGNLMHDVRDLATVLACIIEPQRGPRRYGVFGHFIPWDDMGGFLAEVTGSELTVRRLPDSFFLAMGRVGDLMSHVGVQLPLDHAAARFMTELVPGDDSATRAEFGLEWRSAEETFSDLLRWLVAAGHLDASKAPALR